MTAKITITAALAIAVVGCASTDDKKAAAVIINDDVKLVCIQENPDADIDDLLTVMKDGWLKHGINSLQYQVKPPARCRYTLWYTAAKGWDMAPYIKNIELRLRLGNEVVAEASYKYSGGFALSKWANTQKKLDPLIDELLAQLPGSKTGTTR